MKVHNELTKTRVYLIAFLVFSMNFLPPLISITSQGVYPKGVEMLNSLLVGFMQVVVTLYALLEREKKDGDGNE